ncbi:MAG: aminomethyl-transferring glycine dehydrogenase subunit GcvPB [Candidatus Aureabacteria bacterium]|nr:aminomethyl-transferring glycine dehydrogenase subunit GcvPB [Candidatus Auribacterota bacterium]
MKNDSLTIFEKSREGRSSFSISKSKIDNIELSNIPAKYLRDQKARLPEVSERDLVSHYVKLSNKNMHVDANFYPLGSCTMKYNPKINEDIAACESFKKMHPLQSDDDLQGILKLIYEFEEFLCDLIGFDVMTLHPAAGAHGEMTALMMAKKYFESKGDEGRHIILVPDSSHGTNPSSAFMCGFDKVVTVKSDENGEIDINDLKEKCSKEVACLMVTNPNTLGIFETRITDIAKIVHDNGALLYGDGANMNALMGITRPGDMGFDFMHLNLHKTFSAPHGGGGPGSGPVGVKEFLKQFLPKPVIVKNKNRFSFKDDQCNTIGAVRAFYGNLSVIVKAFCYIKSLGKKELKRSSMMAVLNARYLYAKLKNIFPVPYDKPCLHEFVMSIKPNDNGVHTVDLAKALIDFGIHPPTVYFPLIVREAIMIEPTETESIETLDDFISIMESIAQDIEKDPKKIKDAPKTTPVMRLDEVGAARKPIVNWFDIETE